MWGKKGQISDFLGVGWGGVNCASPCASPPPWPSIFPDSVSQREQLVKDQIF
jgi:hypothetical protein